MTENQDVAPCGTTRGARGSGHSPPRSLGHPPAGSRRDRAGGDHEVS